MDVVDHELKRYDQMKADLDKRKNPDGNPKEIIKSSDNLDSTIMDVEKPKDVRRNNISMNNEIIYSKCFLDGTTKT